MAPRQSKGTQAKQQKQQKPKQSVARKMAVKQGRRQVLRRGVVKPVTKHIL